MEPSTSGAIRPSIPPHSGKDRPIIFSAPMVRALLDGRKTMTRRVLTPQPEDGVKFSGIEKDGSWLFTKGCFYEKMKARYSPGDQLYVRENWSHSGDGVWSIFDARLSGRDGVIYAADWANDFKPKWFPSIHMPREFSRLTLLVESVKVERLQDISEADARAEGCDNDCDPFWRPSYADPDSGGYPSCKNSFEWLWQSLHGPEAWALNPWVCAISFRTIKANIDNAEARNV